MSEIERIKKKHKKKEVPKQKNFSYTYYFSRFLLLIIVTLLTLICLKQNDAWKKTFYKYVWENHLSFAKIGKMYEDKFGSAIPFKDFLNGKSETVFEEKLSYKETSKYKEGARLTVQTNYLVPALEKGMVVFVGEKENYGNCIIIEGTDGKETWYGNFQKTNVKVYDFIEKGSYLGETKDNFLYLVFKKDGVALDYTKYIP